MDEPLRRHAEHDLRRLFHAAKGPGDGDGWIDGCAADPLGGEFAVNAIDPALVAPGRLIADLLNKRRDPRTGNRYLGLGQRAHDRFNGRACRYVSQLIAFCFVTLDDFDGNRPGRRRVDRHFGRGCRGQGR